ncbi:MAG: alkanesulfonate monooxygenase [Phenylobacterium sp.]|jgi:alkanesulfonate monooxygenase
MNLKFHWMLPKGGEVDTNGKQTPQQAAQYRLEYSTPSSGASQPDLNGWLHFAKTAEEAGIDSVLVAMNRYEPDPTLIACSLGAATDKLKFILALRTGLMGPATTVQQINTLSAMINGRVSLNIIAGSSKEEQEGYGDYLNHDDRYTRAGEFLSICNTFWQGENKVSFTGKHYQISKGHIATQFDNSYRQTPEIFISGHSQPAKQLTTSQGTCWVRVIDTPEKLAPEVAQMREQGIEVCLRLAIICRPSKEEALSVINEISAYTSKKSAQNHGTAVVGQPDKDDSQMFREAKMVAKDSWLSDLIWTGFVADCSPVWTTLVGTPAQLADQFLQYQRIGVTQFIISGWPETNEVEIFGKEIMPLIRAAQPVSNNNDRI